MDNFIFICFGIWCFYHILKDEPISEYDPIVDDPDYEI